MSKYTYHIAFNSSDYTEVFPTIPVKVSGKRDENFFIIRDEISEIKINKSLNSSVYDTLESWFNDSTKFGNELSVIIKKSGVAEWECVFGIKQGKIDYELKTYTIKPTTKDEYTDIFKAIDIDMNVSSTRYLYRLDEDDTYSGLANFTAVRVNELFKNGGGVVSKINSETGTTYTVKSSFLWNDNWPNGGSSGTLNVISSDYNYLNNLFVSPVGTATQISFGTAAQLFDLLKMLQCYWYVDSNGEIRVEHVSWFMSMVNNYQVDLGGFNQVDKNIFEYIDTEYYNRERFKQSEESDSYDKDYDRVDISYDYARTKYYGNAKETTFDRFANISDANSSNDNIIAVGVPNLVGGYVEGTGWTSFDFTGGSLSASAPTDSIEFKLFLPEVVVTYSIDMEYSSGTDRVEMIAQLGSGLTTGTPVTLSEGNTSGTITIPSGGNLLFYVIYGATTFEMSANITRNDYYRIPWEEGKISTEIKCNGYLCTANILDRFYRDYRISRVGYLNGSLTTFDSTQFIKRQETIRLYYPDSIDGMRGIKTDYGIAMIESYERDLDTDYVNFSLLYQEDE